MPHSDQIVTAKAVLQAQLELQRVGINKAISNLEKAEPDLAEFVIETLTSNYHALLRTGVTAKQARKLHSLNSTLVLIALGALRHAYAKLWSADDEESTPPTTPPNETQP